ncbi:MAG: GNAT family N-acetyltransferase [Acidiferrobacterales bacterium]|nr:GNAT family N-acetyltransferase [Acidiferrobacterales bacterium]
MEISFRKANLADRIALEDLRAEAFSPVFASFRKILGDEIYELAQKREDDEQSELLSAMFFNDSEWDLYVVELQNEIVGFISLQINSETTVGEIGLNAVKPSYTGKGIGTKMYDFANAEMKAAGMRVATVATGGDESHAPARRAYEKSGFDVRIPSVWYCRTL